MKPPWSDKHRTATHALVSTMAATIYAGRKKLTEKEAVGIAFTIGALIDEVICSSINAVQVAQAAVDEHVKKTTKNAN